MENKANDRIERYIYQVGRYLPKKNRADIEQEIRTLIGDMLEERCGGREAQQKDIDIVLIELGDPRTLAAKYTEKGGRYLIGPAIYPRYIFVLKIVGLCVAGGVTIAMIVQSFINTEVPPLSHYANWIGTLLSALMGMFTWITLLFALIENRENSRIGQALGKGYDEVERELAGDTGGAFLDSLPEVPQKKAEISRSDAIFGICFSAVFLVLFVVAPQWMAVYLPDGAGGVTLIPLFNLDTLRSLVLPVLLCVALGMVRDVARLSAGQHSLRLALVTIACDLPALFLVIYIVTRKDLFNADLMSQITHHLPEAAGAMETVGTVLGILAPILIALFVFSFVLDMATSLYKGIKYN